MRKLGETCIVLGAGASRGAKCVDRKSSHPIPVDLEFFKVAQALNRDGSCEQDSMMHVLMQVQELWGMDTPPGLEEVFNAYDDLEFYLSEVHTFSPGEAFHSLKRDLLEVIVEVFREVLLTADGEHARCRLHKKLADMLEAGDTLISFNYDCLMDLALHDRQRSNPAFGYTYGFGDDVPFGASNDKPEHDGNVLLLKPHGSLNWKRRDEGMSIVASPDFREPFIVPPSYVKRPRDQFLGLVWRSLYERLAKCESMVCVGYSFPPADGLARAVFRAASWARKQAGLPFKSVIAVNPCPEHRIMLFDIVASPPQYTDYQEFSDLESFLDAIR